MSDDGEMIAPPAPEGPLQAPPLWTGPEPQLEPRDLGAPLVIAVLIGGIAADLALRHPPWNGVATSIAVAVVVAALLASGRFKARSSQGALVLAAVLGLFLSVRTNPALVIFDVLGILTLAWYAATHSRGRSLWDTSPVRLLVRATESVGLGLVTIFDVGMEFGARQRRARTSGRLAGSMASSIVRGGIIAVPLLLILGLLLASADAVFASFFDFGEAPNLTPLIGHALLIALGCLSTLVLLRLSGRDFSTKDNDFEPPRLGLVETLVVLISLDLLFAAFGVAQLIAAFGGADRVLSDAGLTFKEYARQGFFQLLWVATLTVGVLVVLDVVSRHLERGRRAVQIASLVAVGLTLTIVVAAFIRLSLYITYDGQTPLRFYSSAFSLWIGLVFVMLAVRIWGIGAATSWFTSAVGCSAVVVLIVMNIINPEAIIANHNIERGDGQILFHMSKYSADGNLVLAERIDDLDPDIRELVLEKFCDDYRIADSRGERTGLEFNLAESRLDDRYETVCAST